jgi:chemotaxis signal transduction protein
VLRAQYRVSRSEAAQQPRARRSRGFLVFAIGGRQFAARMEEVASVRPWPQSLLVPSDTPFISALVRFEDECMAVYDLAARLNCTVDSADALCLIVKHEDGPLAIRIDPAVPSLHMADPAAIQEQPGFGSDIAGICTIGEEQVRVLHLTRLGKPC